MSLYFQALDSSGCKFRVFVAVSAQSLAGAFSSHVIDEEANPIAGATVALRELHTGATDISKTDETGIFSISTTTSTVKIMLLPKNRSGYTIRKVNVASVIFYPIRQEYDFGCLIFTTT